MEILLLLLLLASAGLLYLPEVLRGRVLDSPIDTISDFKRGMTAIAISTHNYQPGFDGKYCYSPVSASETEPYVRHRRYSSSDENDDIIPYPRNHARENMLARQKRIISLLLVLMLGTGIATAVPGLRWVLPIHLTVLVITAVYLFMVMLMPQQQGRRRR